MKKLTTLLFLSISLFVFSQNDLSKETARTFADKIATSAETDYEFVKIKEVPKLSYYEIRYAPKKATTKDLQFGCDTCLKVVFKIGNDTTLNFSEVTGTLNDLFPTWKREFLPNAKKENVLNYDDRNVRKNNRRVHSLDKIAGIWKITNYKWD